MPPQQVADHLQEHPHHIEEYMLEIRRGKALALIVEAADVTDSNGATIELASLQEDGTIGRAAASDRVDAESARPHRLPKSMPGICRPVEDDQSGRLKIHLVPSAGTPVTSIGSFHRCERDSGTQRRSISPLLRR